MTAIHRINPEIFVMTPLGEAMAVFLIDYGPEHNTVWLVSLNDSRDMLHVDSSEIRMMGNAMYDLPDGKPFTGRKIK